MEWLSVSTDPSHLNNGLSKLLTTNAHEESENTGWTEAGWTTILVKY
jgi:hypothetical protein